MNKTLYTLLAFVFATASLSAESVFRPSREELERFVATSEVVAVVFITDGPEKTSLELTDILFAKRDAAKKGTVIEVAPSRPNSGVRPPVAALVFFPTFPPKDLKIWGIIVGTDKVEVVKEIIAKKRANQSPEPMSVLRTDMAHL